MSCKISSNQVNELIKEYGSPLYVFHSADFVKNYTELLNTFRAIYPKYNIAYSYKTNYTPAICKTVKELGGLAEVVSDMEYRLARKIGYENKDIIYNGPVKGDGMYEHLLSGGVVNVDSIDELKKIIIFAKENSEKVFRLAFRVNIDIDQGFVSRFGLDAYEEDKCDCELDKAIRMVREQENLSIVGLHCHVGRSRSIAAWENRVRIMLKLVKRYFAEAPEFIDLGSGMNSVMEDELAKQFGGDIPTFSDYAKVVAQAMKEEYGVLPENEQPMLYTEPGTTVISGYVSFLGSVLGIKNVKDKQYATFDCSGGNIGDICHLKQLPITVYRNGGEPVLCHNADFVGYTCLEHDVMYKDFCGELAVGDVVQFRNTGSYSNVFKPPFILPNCAMVQLDESGKSKLIKTAEDFDYIFQNYIF